MEVTHSRRELPFPPRTSYERKPSTLTHAGQNTLTHSQQATVANPREFLEPTVVPIDVVRQAVKEFVLSGGQRPTCLEWREEPYRPLGTHGERVARNAAR
ncbi:Imm1 family immunity protein [Streptomyces sp. NPDC021080]|uniref:Imm1 family immunity protein n=1 Tax=Streptomyces sp. NPDC021080 TaxID=3365110 RepID=UPI0037A55606